MQAVQSYRIEHLDKNEVLRYMGYAGQQLDEQLEHRIEQGIEHALEHSRPRGVVRIFELAGTSTTADGTPQVLLEGSSLVLEGHSITEHLAGAQAVGVFAVTLSMDNERELKRLSLAGSSVDHLAFDAASSALVERAADAAEASVVTQARQRNLYTNYRFSPGYGDLPMQTQPPLLAALDATRLLGITLAPSLLMTPTKSVTALVGLFDKPQKSTHASCAGCPCFDFCTIRTSGRTCHDRSS